MGSEMCIRDSPPAGGPRCAAGGASERALRSWRAHHPSFSLPVCASFSLPVCAFSLHPPPLPLARPSAHPAPSRMGAAEPESQHHTSEADEAAAALQSLLDDEEDDLAGFEADAAVQQALNNGQDLRQYAEEVENALRAVERESINDYIKESESLAGLHTQIRECDGVLDTMESMLRGFQADLASISSQIKYLQDESLSMNVKLRNRKAAEMQLSSFITQIVVPPELISNICDAEVDEAYLGHVQELNKKVQFAKLESTAMTSACADISPELEKLRIKSVQKIRDFLLDRIGRLRRKMTNTQILQASVLLKYRGLYHFLQEHAPEVTAEVRETYTATMSGVYLTKVRDYLGGLLALKAEVRYHFLHPHLLTVRAHGTGTCVCFKVPARASHAPGMSTSASLALLSGGHQE